MTSAINNISSNEVLTKFGIPASQVNAAKKLGQSDFLKLLSAQMSHQDPTSPADSSAFLGQLAQFATADGVQSLQSSVNNLTTSLASGQTLQAANLVGKSVLVASDQGVLEADKGMQGAVALSNSADQVNVAISDSAGNVVKHMALGAQAAGIVDFKWDGTTDSGAKAPPGNYSIKATGVVGGKSTALTTASALAVKSIDTSNNALALNVDLVGNVDVQNILRVY